MNVLCLSKTALPLNKGGAYVSMGNFDGLHLGHQNMLSLLVEKAKAMNSPSVVILFEPQPAELFQKNEAPSRLTNFREKYLLLQQMGVDYIAVIPFNRTMAALTPEAFLETVVLQNFPIRTIIVGEDFRFGRERSGNIDFLTAWGKMRGIGIHVFPDFADNVGRISSTRLRQALSKADFIEAEKLIGRKYTIYGRVGRGAGLGRTWGIPTMNVLLKRRKSPLLGVFCVNVAINGKKELPAVANLGFRPTVDGLSCVLEVHLLNDSIDAYGSFIEVTFLSKIRDEQRFANIDELIKQIHNDVHFAKVYFGMPVQKTICAINDGQ